jgi:hypothetical protein
VAALIRTNRTLLQLDVSSNAFGPEVRRCTLQPECAHRENTSLAIARLTQRRCVAQ